MHSPATVLLGDDPRCYREVLGEFLRARRPDLRVLVVEPEEIDRYVEGFHPALVICSRLTPAVEQAPAWMVLYPDQEGRVILSLGGHRVEQPDLDLEDLLAFLDRAERLYGAG